MAATGTLQIEMPAMGESVSEGTVLEWHKNEGDFVEEGETVVEVSTDKVDAEVPAPASGTITKLLVEIDDVVKVGQALAELEAGRGRRLLERLRPRGHRGGRSRRRASTATGCRTPAAAARATRISARASRRNFRKRSRATSRTQEGDAPAEGSGETVDLQMPEMGESVSEGTVLEWHKGPGDAVEEGETIVEVSTDKVDAEVPSPATGTLRRDAGRGRRDGQRRPGARRGSRPARPAARQRRRRGPPPKPRRAPRPRPSTPTRRPRPSRSGSPPPRASISPASRAPAPAAR